MADQWTELVRARIAAQGLSAPPATSAMEVVDRLLAVQAQDQRGARLSIRSRSTGLRAADVDADLAAGTLVVSWLNRGTLHLVTAADYRWLHPLTNPQLVTTNQRRLAQEGVTPAQAAAGVAAVGEAVAAGPRTRAELRECLDQAGVPTRGQALVHVLVAASIAGVMVRGPVVGGESAFVSVGGWLGPPPAPIPREEARARLARRYLRGHGPATAADLGKWAGISLGEARQGLAAIAGEVEPVAGGPSQGSADPLLRLADQPPPPPLPTPRLLGPFEPLLLGWVSRRPIVGPHTHVATDNGIFRPFALVDGRLVALWRLVKGRVTVEPVEPLAASDLERLEDDAADVLRFLGMSPPPTRS